MSLVNLAERIDIDFYSQIIEIVKTSKLYSIRKFVTEKTGEKVNGFKTVAPTDATDSDVINFFRFIV